MTGAGGKGGGRWLEGSTLSSCGPGAPWILEERWWLEVGTPNGRLSTSGCDVSTNVFFAQDFEDVRI